ncbi:MAG TPA: hypothetical protein VFN49_00425 [Candidatus Aquilonibacter sp.]|nr:hypothetical protein [Candidatus Aquilonibacter sp.]
MNTPLIRSAVAGLALCGVMMTSIAAPARADGAATTRTIIGAAAAIAGIATAINVENKHRRANTVVGYLDDGSTVYADGRVVSRNGYSWYPGNQGQQVACNGQSCYVYNNGQNNYGYNNGGYNNGAYNNGGYYGNGQYNDNDGDEGNQYYGQQRHQRRNRPPQ